MFPTSTTVTLAELGNTRVRRERELHAGACHSSGIPALEHDPIEGTHITAHSRASGNPEAAAKRWVPAFAGTSGMSAPRSRSDFDLVHQRKAAAHALRLAGEPIEDGEIYLLKARRKERDWRQHHNRRGRNCGGDRFHADRVLIDRTLHRRLRLDLPSQKSRFSGMRDSSRKQRALRRGLSEGEDAAKSRHPL